MVYGLHECFNLVEYKCMVFHLEHYGGESGILIMYYEDLLWEWESSWTYVGSCDLCQRTGALAFRKHWPLTPVIPIAPFEKWGFDFVGPINMVSARRNRYIILATDYATKWIKESLPGRTMQQQ